MKKERIKYSIIVPIYNCEKYLKRCIDSLARQKTDNKFEIILLNDGSNDKSIEICNKCKKEHRNIKVIDKANTGVSDTRNMGLKISIGEYILFCDADDYIEDGYLQEIDKITEKKSYDLINFGFFSEVEGKSEKRQKINYTTKKYLSKKEIKKDLIELWDHSMMYNIVNKAFKSSIIRDNNIKFPRYNFGEDMNFVMEYVNCINSFFTSSECFYHYVRERNGASTKIYRDNFFELRKKEFEKINKYFEDWEINKEDFYEFSCRRFSDRVLGCLENVFCGKMKFSRKYKIIKGIINDEYTKTAMKHTKKISKKNIIMRIPIKLKSTLLTMIEFSVIHYIKEKNPDIFNYLKNKR